MYRNESNDLPPVDVAAALEATIAERVDEALKHCLEHAAEGLHWVGPDGTILWANQTELDLLGYTREEYIGRNIAEFHVDQCVIEDILARLTRGETLLNYEARLRCNNGSVRDVLLNSNVLWRDNQFLHTRCFTRDVTDRKKTDDLVRWVADIVEHSEDAIISQDSEGIITSCNPAAQRLYGHSGAEAIGQSIRIIIPRDREHEEADVVRRVRDGDRIPPFDTVRRHKDGSNIDVALTVSPIRDREGRIVGASKMARDISKRKRLEVRDRFLVELDDALRSLAEAETITYPLAGEGGLVTPSGPVTIAPTPDAVRVLVVDDNVDGADMLAAALTARGYDARVAHDPPTALRIAAEFQPKVGFLDLGLPVMDGYELAARLRERAGPDGITLVAVTGYGQPSDRQKTRNAGFHHHLVKPVDFGAIEALLAEAGCDGDDRALAPLDPAAKHVGDDQEHDRLTMRKSTPQWLSLRRLESC